MQEWSLPIPPDEAMRLVASLIRHKLGWCSPDLLSTAMLAVVQNAHRYDPQRGAASTFVACVAFSAIAARRSRRLNEEETRWLELQEEISHDEQPPRSITISAVPELQDVVDRLVDAAERLSSGDEVKEQYVKDASRLATEVIAWYNSSILDS